MKASYKSYEPDATFSMLPNTSYASHVETVNENLAYYTKNMTKELS